MPNHCENRMQFYLDDPKKVAEILDKIGEKDEDGTFVVDFEKLIPMPEILKRTRSGSRGFEVDGETVRVSVWTFDGDPDELGIGGEERMLNAEEAAEIEALGCTSWYDWACNHWGTKWNAYDQENEVDEGGARLVFNTAWGPPEPWIKKLRETFPDVSFSGVYVVEFDEAAGHL